MKLRSSSNNRPKLSVTHHPSQVKPSAANPHERNKPNRKRKKRISTRQRFHKRWKSSPSPQILSSKRKSLSPPLASIHVMALRHKRVAVAKASPQPQDLPSERKTPPPPPASTHVMALRHERVAVATVRPCSPVTLKYLSAIYLKSSQCVMGLRNAIKRAHAPHRRPLSRGWLSIPNLISSQDEPSTSEHTRKVFEDLHLPLYDRNDMVEAEPSVSLLSTCLGWTISSTKPVPVPYVLQQDSTTLPRPYVEALPFYAHKTGIALNLIPSDYLETKIHFRIQHERERYLFAHPVLPNEWEPLCSKPIYYVPSGTSDSYLSEVTKLERGFKPGLLPSPEPVISPFAEHPPMFQSISVPRESLLHLRSRLQWETMLALDIERIPWRMESSSAMSQKDDSRRVGNINRNQNSKNRDSWPQNSLPRLAMHCIPIFETQQGHADHMGNREPWNPWGDSQRETRATAKELCARYPLGDIIANVLTSDLLPITHNAIINPPPAICCSNKGTTLDLVAIPPTASLKWGCNSNPILFIAQSYHDGEEDRAKAQMSYAVHSTLITLVMYYLDTRSALNEQIPDWMIVYGIAYHDEGFTVHAHFPVFHFSAGDTHQSTSRGFGWAFYSYPVMRFDILSGSPHLRRREIMALLRIQSHATFMLQQLRAWDGYKRTLKLLY